MDILQYPWISMLLGALGSCWHGYWGLADVSIHGYPCYSLVSIRMRSSNDAKCVHTSFSSITCGRQHAAPAMAKKIRSKGGVLEIGRVRQDRKTWRVQVKIFDKWCCGPSRSSAEAANADLDNLRKSGGRKEMQRFLAKLHRRVQQAKKEKVEEQKAKDKLHKFQKRRQKREKSEPGRLKRGPQAEKIKDPWLREVKMKLANARELNKRDAEEDKKEAERKQLAEELEWKRKQAQLRRDSKDRPKPTKAQREAIRGWLEQLNEAP